MVFALQHQQQHLSSSSDMTAWRKLELTAAVPSPEQLLLAIEAALLNPNACAATAAKLLRSTLETMKCCGDSNSLAAAGELLLQPILQLLGPAVLHMLAAATSAQSDHDTDLSAAKAQDACGDFTAVVSLLMAAGEHAASGDTVAVDGFGQLVSSE
jgi:hypothetical protein